MQQAITPCRLPAPTKDEVLVSIALVAQKLFCERGLQQLGNRLSQAAANNCGQELTGQSAMQGFQPPDRNVLHFLHRKLASPKYCFKIVNGHLIQSTFDFGKRRGSVLLELSSPSNQGISLNSRCAHGKTENK